MGRYNRTPDAYLQVAAPAQYTATTSTTGVGILSCGAGDEALEIVINCTAQGGTHDVSNNFYVVFEAAEVATGPWSVVKEIPPVVLGTDVIGLNTREITEAVGSQDAAFYRVTVTKQGTTATSIDLSVDLNKAK